MSLTSFVVSTVFPASCYQAEQKAELAGKALTAGLGAGNIISAIDGSSGDPQLSHAAVKAPLGFRCEVFTQACDKLSQGHCKA